MARKNVNFAKPAPEAAPKERAPTMEAASRTIRIDHLADRAPDDVVIPVFLGSKSVAEEVVSLFTYHGQAHRLAKVGLIQDIAKTTEKASVVLMTISDNLSYLVVDNAVYNELKASPEAGDNSDMETCAVLLDMAYDMRRAATAAGKDEDETVFFVTE